MAGAVIENLSSRKLFVIIGFMVVLEIAFFLVGGLIAPRPTHAMGPSSMKTCKQKTNSNQMITPYSCDPASLAPTDQSGVTPDEVVFVGIIPIQKDRGLVKWFQYLLCFANFRILFSVHNQVEEDAVVTMDLRLAYSDAEWRQLRKPSVWTEFANVSKEERPLECFFNYSKTEEHSEFEYDCDSIFIFQLGSLPHKRYLVNMKLPVNLGESKEYNRKIGQINDIELIGIAQTGGFTVVWLSMKTVLTFVMIFPLVFFWRRVMKLDRSPLLIEKACFTLGLSMVFLNIPFEFITILFDAAWMLLFTDIRQGLFYAVLFSFWVVFAGEHLMDQVHRNKLSSYKWHLTCIFLTSFALFSFDLAERGAQLVNPFGTIWSHPAIGYGLIAVAAVSAAIYLILLFYLVYKVFRSIRYKRRFILQNERAVRFRVIVSRLKHIMVLTLVTAGLTIAFFFLEQKLDGIINEVLPVTIEISSAFFTGIYGLWNIYVFIVLSMYAPSHKLYDVVQVAEGNSEEEHEMAALNQNTEQTDILQVAQQKERED